MELGLELFVTLLCILSSRGYRQGGLEDLHEVYLGWPIVASDSINI